MTFRFHVSRALAYDVLRCPETSYVFDQRYCVISGQCVFPASLFRISLRTVKDHRNQICVGVMPGVAGPIQRRSYEVALGVAGVDLIRILADSLGAVAAGAMVTIEDLPFLGQGLRVWRLFVCELLVLFIGEKMETRSEHENA